MQRPMCNIWAKVCYFLEKMDIQDSCSSLPLTYTSSSSSLSCSSSLHPLSLNVERWQVGEKTIKQILAVIQPTADSEKRRGEIIEYLQTLIEHSFGIKLFPFGSVPLKTYLPHGDVDLTAVSHYNTGQDLAADIHNLLQIEMTNNTTIQVRDVVYVPAQVKVIKCTVSNIAVDVSFNQTAGLYALSFLEQVDQFIGKDHLFKRSLILIKAWCYYESRLHGGYHGLISTYALEALVLHVINHFHCSLHCPLAVLYKFLEYYSTFDWERYCVAVNGLVSISSLPEIAVDAPYDSDELLLTDEFLGSFREAFLSSKVVGTRPPSFPVKFLNIMDPLRDDNNLGRCVSKGNFYRIRSALSYGTEKLSEVLILPPEKIDKGLENFFVNTLEKNGKGRRADVLVPVPAYAAGASETSSANEDRDGLLYGIEYDLWFNDYGIVSPVNLNTLVTPPVWSNEWEEMHQNMPYDQNIYYDVDESPPSSADSPLSLQRTNAVSGGEKRKSKGTGLYIPSSVDSPLNLQQTNAASGGEKGKLRGPGLYFPSSVDSPLNLQRNNAASKRDKGKSRGTSLCFPSSVDGPNLQQTNVASERKKGKSRGTSLCFPSSVDSPNLQQPTVASERKKGKSRGTGLYIPSSVDSPLNLQQFNAASEGEKGRSRGTGLYIPSSADSPLNLLQSNAASKGEKGRSSGTGLYIPSSADSPLNLQQSYAASKGEKGRLRVTGLYIPSSATSPLNLQQSNAASEGAKGRSRGTGLYIPSSVDSPLNLQQTNASFEGGKGRSRGTGPCISYSVDSPLSLEQTNAASEGENAKSRGTGLYIPNLVCLIESNIGLEGGGMEEEEAKEKESEETKTVDSQVGYSLEEFPPLPGSKPIPIKVSQFKPKKHEELDYTFASEGSHELQSLKCLSPRSVSLSEQGKQSDFDVPATQDMPNDPAVTVGCKQESSKSNEKMVIQMEPLELKDEKEFPPLSSVRPALPGIRFTKKEFPPLSANLKSEKQGNRTKNFKERRSELENRDRSS